jgi:hypothetical protein
MIYIYVVITLEIAALYKQNTVALSVTDAPAKRVPTMCPLWKTDHSPTLQYFPTNFS